MSHYALALFLHIVGALAFFAALGLEWAALHLLGRAATPEQRRIGFAVLGGLGRFGPIGMLVLLISGGLMMVSSWGLVPWLAVALATLVILAAVNIVVSRPRMQALERSLDEGGLAFQHAIRHPLLWAAMYVRIALALGIVFLMAVKPDTAGALLAVAVAALVGLAGALTWPRRGRTQDRPAV
jgi:hypothetical protein